ncbi:MAG: glycosyltransferase family A protein [Cytophagales bacterium]
MVSVIIPNYNHAKYLKQRIDSVLNQTYQDFEVIILDDCSTDNSREVIESYRGQEKISHIVYNEQNSGSTFKQWDKGFTLAKGEYIWIAESDDVAELDFLKTCLISLQKDEQLSMVSVNSQIIDAEGKVLQNGYGLKCYEFEGSQDYHIHNGLNLIEAYMIHNNVISNASGVLFRKDIAMSLDQCFKSYKLNGDWLFWMLLMKDHKVALTRTVHNKFRKHIDTVRNNVDYSKSIIERYQLFGLLTDILKLDKDKVFKAQFKFSLFQFEDYRPLEVLHEKGFLKEDENLNKRLFWERYFGKYSSVIGIIFQMRAQIYDGARIVYFFIKAVYLKLCNRKQS